MKIFSDHLTRGNILASAPAGTTVVECEIVYGIGNAIKRNRKRENCFNVRLSGNGKSGMWGGLGKCATWDEWGYFLATIFAQDEEAICGDYTDEDDFHDKTEYKFHRTCRSCDKPIDNNLGYCGAPICMRG